MAKGTWEGLGLPRFGEYEQEQQTAANDIATLTGVESQTGNFISVKLGASGITPAVIMYDSNVGGVTNSFLTASGSLAPTYLFSVGASAAGIGAAADNGFVVGATTLQITTGITSAQEWSYAKVLCGSAVFHILLQPATGMA